MSVKLACSPPHHHTPAPERRPDGRDSPRGAEVPPPDGQQCFQPPVPVMRDRVGELGSHQSFGKQWEVVGMGGGGGEGGRGVT